MKASTLLTALAIGALTAEVGATPTQKKVAQAKADVALVRKDEHTPVKFCQNYLKGKKKTSSPIKNLPVPRLSKACATITSAAKASQAAKSSKAAAAAAKKSSASNAAAESNSKAAAQFTQSATAVVTSSAATVESKKPSAAPMTTGASASASAVVTPSAGTTRTTAIMSGASSSTDSVMTISSGAPTPTDKGVPVVTNLGQIGGQASANSTARVYSSSTRPVSLSSSSSTSSSSSASATPTRTATCTPCDDGSTLVGYGLSVRNDATNAGGYLLIPQGVNGSFPLLAGAPSKDYSPLPFTSLGDELTAGNYVMALGDDGTLQMVDGNSTMTPLHWELDYDDCAASFTVTNGSGSFDALYLQLTNGKYAVNVGNEPTYANATQPAYIDLAPICSLGNVTTGGNSTTAASRRRLL